MSNDQTLRVMGGVAFVTIVVIVVAAMWWCLRDCACAYSHAYELEGYTSGPPDVTPSPRGLKKVGEFCDDNAQCESLWCMNFTCGQSQPWHAQHLRYLNDKEYRRGGLPKMS